MEYVYSLESYELDGRYFWGIFTDKDLAIDEAKKLLKNDRANALEMFTEGNETEEDNDWYALSYINNYVTYFVHEHTLDEMQSGKMIWSSRDK
jgi:hypothetical protein